MPEKIVKIRNKGVERVLCIPADMSHMFESSTYARVLITPDGLLYKPMNDTNVEYLNKGRPD